MFKDNEGATWYPQMLIYHLRQRRQSLRGVGRGVWEVRLSPAAVSVVTVPPLVNKLSGTDRHNLVHLFKACPLYLLQGKTLVVYC